MIHLQKQTEPQTAQQSSWEEKAARLANAPGLFPTSNFASVFVLVTFCRCDQIKTQEKQLEEGRVYFGPESERCMVPQLSPGQRSGREHVEELSW